MVPRQTTCREEDDDGTPADDLSGGRRGRKPGRRPVGRKKTMEPWQTTCRGEEEVVRSASEDSQDGRRPNVERFSVPSSPPPNPSIFSPGRSLQLPGLRPLPGSVHYPSLTLLLLLSGQCPNPGPPYPCGVCNRNVTWGGTSYWCSSCQRWVHARCCDLTSTSQYVLGVWCCSACFPAPVPRHPTQAINLRPQPLFPPSSPRPSSTPSIFGRAPAPSLVPPAPSSAAPPPPARLSPPAQPPAPASAAPVPPRVRGHFLQFNTNGILNSQQQLYQLLVDQEILVACIQETKLTAASTLPNLNGREPFPGYAVLRKDRPHGRGVGSLHWCTTPLLTESFTIQSCQVTVLPKSSQ